MRVTGGLTVDAAEAADTTRRRAQVMNGAADGGAQELDEGFVVVGARTELEHEVGVAAIGLEHQRHCQ